MAGFPDGTTIVLQGSAVIPEATTFTFRSNCLYAEGRLRGLPLPGERRDREVLEAAITMARHMKAAPIPDALGTAMFMCIEHGEYDVHQLNNRLYGGVYVVFGDYIHEVAGSIAKPPLSGASNLPTEGGHAAADPQGLERLRDSRKSTVSRSSKWWQFWK